MHVPIGEPAQLLGQVTPPPVVDPLVDEAWQRAVVSDHSQGSPPGPLSGRPGGHLRDPAAVDTAAVVEGLAPGPG